MELSGSCLRSERWKARGSELGQLALQAIEFAKYSFTVHKNVVVAENQSYSSISKTSKKIADAHSWQQSIHQQQLM